MTYEEALAYLASFTNYEQQHDAQAMREVQLSRMRRLCQRLGDPQRSFRSIVVAGTNGKGSICAMLYGMLRETSLRAGLYTSPHLEDMRERIRVWDSSSSDSAPRAWRDDWIPEETFAAIVEWLHPVLEALRREEPSHAPTYFEVLTAIALLYFRQRRVDVAVLEVGLGGRLDATNIIEQAISIIGPIDFDHTDVLGRDLEAIAKEKAGIIKPHQTVITSPQHETVMAVLSQTCAEQGVPLVVCGRDIHVAITRHDWKGLQLSMTGLRGIYESVTLPLVGRHQANNAVMAVSALEALSGLGTPHAAIERGLANVEWPGRFELIHPEPLVVLDGAHNAHATHALRETLVELCAGRPLYLLIGMSADKSVEGIGELLGELAASVMCTKSRHPRAMDPAQLAGRFFPFCAEVHVMADPIDAYTYLLNTVPDEGVIVVTGSLFLVGELRAALQRSHLRKLEDAPCP